MKKNFPLKAEGKVDARVRDKIRHEINKYVRREQQKALPEGMNRWNFACRAGANAASAEPLEIKEIGPKIDEVAEGGAEQIYIEILAAAIHRPSPAR